VELASGTRPPGPAGSLPELARVYWRPRMDAAALDRRERFWTGVTAAHVLPLASVAVLIAALEPLAAPVSAIALAKAWIIPALYAQRGANVARGRARSEPDAERRALGLLGDLVGHDARETFAATGLLPEAGRLGTWLVGEQGALLVRPGGRRVDCWCVRVPEPDLPAADRVAHLLLALRADEEGFATLANLAFSGAQWRVRRRLPEPARPALEAAARASAR
jgi:hypothetical protein